MDGRLIVVKAARDTEAGVWFVEHSDLPGLNVEADSMEELMDKLPAVVADLIGDESGGPAYEVPIELIAHASTKVRVREAA